jgi:hypothetical protein
LLSKDSIPPLPSPATLAAFHSRFATQEDILECRDSQNLLVDERTVIFVRTSSLLKPVKYAADAARLEEFWYAYFATYCARFGVTLWRPDLRDTPYSMYNAILRIIVIDTFRQAVLAGAYRYKGADPDLMSNMLMLFRMYDNFVHHRQRNRFLIEMKNPGALLAQEAKGAAYAGRDRVSLMGCVSSRMSTNYYQIAEARAKFLKGEGYPPEVCRLVADPKANSDDERDPATGHHVISPKDGRHERVTQFIIEIDERRKKETLQSGKAWRERTRVRSPNAPPSTLRTLPDDVPLDWFDPDFYASLSNRSRCRVTPEEPSIALPPAPVPLFTNTKSEQWWKLPRKDFMEKYGNEVLAQYELPDDRDVGDAAEDEEADDLAAAALDDDEDGYMVDDDQALGPERNVWVTMLSDK